MTAGDRPPPRRGLRHPEHPPGVLRGALPPRRLATAGGSRTRPWPPTSPSSTNQGRAPASASTTVAAACFRARLAGESSPAGERTARVLAGYRRTAGDRGRGQARPFGGPGRRPRHLPTSGAGAAAGVSPKKVALERGRLDAVIAGLLFMAGMRQSEVSALRCGRRRRGGGHRPPREDEPGGEMKDVRFVKGGGDRAIAARR